MTPEMMSQITVWRQKAAEGTLTLEEMRQAILALRGDRRGAAVASEKSRKAKAPKAEVRADDLLSELEGL
jgi:hypothetical protein